MKYFLDTEFIEGFRPTQDGRIRHFVDLISIGIVSEDHNEYYAISSEFRADEANDWVQENVLNKIDASVSRRSTTEIAMDIAKFTQGDKNIEFYGYYADYDWVVFCSLFGTMMDLPKGFPMYCLDLKQMMHDAGLTKEWKQRVCPDPEGEHNALVDAKWNFEFYKAVTTFAAHPNSHA